MEFSAPLIKGKLIKRYKRFLADVELSDGSMVTAHCPNTGAMTGCAEPGFEVWLRHSTDPKRKLAYSWELAKNEQGHWIGIHSSRANQLVVEALEQGKLTGFTPYTSLKTEVKYGVEGSRADILLTAPDREDCVIEVKSVTLLANDDGLGCFPDAVSTRGQKHLRELMHMRKQGKRAALIFCVQHTGINRVGFADHIDQEYGKLAREALEHGVEMLAVRCDISAQKIVVSEQVELDLAHHY